jgi:hypothetical protein
MNQAPSNVGSLVRWYVRVGNEAYGPYTSDQMRAYIAEGRVMANSLVAAEGSTEWRLVTHDPMLSSYLVQVQPASSAQPVPVPATVQPARFAPAPQTNAHAQPQPTVGRVAQAQNHLEPETSNFIILFEVKSRSIARIEQAIMNLGPACKLAGNVWIVSTSDTIATVRNTLFEHFGRADALFIADASRGKAAWFNFGPEAEARIRRVWQRPGPTGPAT